MLEYLTAGNRIGIILMVGLVAIAFPVLAISGAGQVAAGVTVGVIFVVAITAVIWKTAEELSERGRSGDR